MTLKEKFENIFKPFRPNTKSLEQCEKIADEFAIDFAEWGGVPIVDANVKELLEIYKKQKGL